MAVLFACVASASAIAQAPPGYYAGVDASNAGSLRSTLHAVIDDHTRYPYTSSSTDTWDILELADEDPTNAGNILDVYRNASYPKQGGGNSFYNREHTWPKSFGFPNDGSSNYAYTDCHMLFLSDSGYNSSRSNKPYRYCGASCTEKVTDLNDGMGGGSGVYSGNSNWTSGSNSAGTWETWIGRRGDVARALLYMDVRYEGGTHGVTSVSEPDLILTDIQSLIDNSNTGSNQSVAYMGLLSVLLSWHVEDPVDDRERSRNDVVYAFQGNRNPFIDHPEWVGCLFSGTCGDTTPPQFPTGLVAIGGSGQVDLNWDDNLESDLSSYNVYRSLDGTNFSAVGTSSTSDYVDTAVSSGTTYYYFVTAVDTSANESTASLSASATPQGGGSGGGDPWINEFHYDNNGSDTGEFVEIAGPAGTDLSGWSVVGYNGSNQEVYKTVSLSGTLPNQDSGFGTLSFAFTSMQNGAPDGLALVDSSSSVVEFLSYEGAFTAVDGPAVGQSSTDVLVSELTTTPIGHSLQRVGMGAQGSDFVWQSPSASSAGSPNSGQSFISSGGSLFYLSFTSGTSVPGVGNVADEDVVSYDPSTGTWEWVFDGSDVGVTTDVNALHVRDDGSMILSFNAPLSIPGLTGGPSGTSIDDSDLVVFTPTSTGSSTAGSFAFLLDGSDVSLSANGEDIDGVHELAGGDLLMTTTGSSSVAGVSGKDEDVLWFTPTQVGSATAGSFAMHFDGSDVGFASSSSEDLSAISMDGGDLLFSCVGTWSASGSGGSDEDLGRFSGTFGSSTSGTASLELVLASLGISTSEDVDGISYRP